MPDHNEMNEMIEWLTPLMDATARRSLLWEMRISEVSAPEVPAPEVSALEADDVDLGDDADDDSDLWECPHCGADHSDDTSSVMVGHMVGCAYCTLLCGRCREPDFDSDCSRVRTSSMSSQLWCESCTEDWSQHCPGCDDGWSEDVMERDDDGDLLCPTCAPLRQPDIVGGYHDGERRAEFSNVVRDTWTRQTGRALGVELEVEGVNDRVDLLPIVQKLLSAADSVANGAGVGRRLLAAERDGSLDHGVEFITAPLSLPLQRLVWTEVLGADVSRLRSHSTTTCGLHVHLSRSALGRLGVIKLRAAVNRSDWEALWRVVARRYSNSYARAKLVPLDGRAGFSDDRYEILNTSNRATVELRIFRGSLVPETVIGCIEMADALARWVRLASLRDLSAAAFLRFVYSAAEASDTRHLRGLIARRVASAAPGSHGDTIRRLVAPLLRHRPRPVAATPAVFSPSTAEV